MGRRRTGFSTQHVSFVGRWSLWSLLWPARWQISWAKLLLARGPILAGSPEDREQSMGPPSVMRPARLDISHILDTILGPLSLEQHGYFSASFMQRQQGHSPDMQAQMHHKTCTVCRRHYTLPRDAVYNQVNRFAPKPLIFRMETGHTIKEYFSDNRSKEDIKKQLFLCFFLVHCD